MCIHLLGLAVASVKTSPALLRHGLAVLPRALTRLGAVLPVDMLLGKEADFQVKRSSTNVTCRCKRMPRRLYTLCWYLILVTEYERRSCKLEVSNEPLEPLKGPTTQAFDLTKQVTLDELHLYHAR